MIIYCGDSEAEGPARYLLGLIKHIHQDVIHVPPGRKIPAAVFKHKINAFIFSDYSHKDLDQRTEKKIAQLVSMQSAGLLMVGGWGSFSGPFGGWRGSEIEALLPVTCLQKDDRRQFPGGAVITLEDQKSFIKKDLFRFPPAICGLNGVRVKKYGKVVVVAQELIYKPGKITLSATKYPLFVMDPVKKIAAITTDLAPHWCGGLVDWGQKLTLIQISPNIAIQVGKNYIHFVSQILRWLIS